MHDRIGDLVYIFAMNGSSVVVVLDGPTRLPITVFSKEYFFTDLQ